jgi:hypothetical protein
LLNINSAQYLVLFVIVADLHGSCNEKFFTIMRGVEELGAEMEPAYGWDRTGHGG